MNETKKPGPWGWTLEIVKILYLMGAGIVVPHDRVAAIAYGPLENARGFNRFVNRWGSAIAFRAGKLRSALARAGAR